jgi:pimeloyl-ACP methyl ester carboxylesterase
LSPPGERQGKSSGHVSEGRTLSVPFGSALSSRRHTFGTRERKNVNHPPDSNRRPADFESFFGGNCEFRLDAAANYPAVRLFRARARSHRQGKDIDTKKCAVYLLGGEYYWSASPADVKALADEIPDAKFAEMKEVSYFPMCENPEALLKALRPVLEDTAGRKLTPSLG